ncbi:AAA family ATPase [Sporofaciens sp. JLR.KK001]
MIPVGTSNFAEIRKKGRYFIDKSELIGQLLKVKYPAASNGASNL